MVNRLSFIPVIGLLFLMCSCDFFFRTPFPQDLVYLDKAVNLKSAIQVPPQEYRLSTLGEIGILRGYYSSDYSLGKLIVFDSNLNILFNHDANVGRMEMIDASGNYIIGNQDFGTLANMASSTPSPAPIPSANNLDGFSDGSINVTVTDNGDSLDLNTYTIAWAPINTYTIDIDPQYRFRSLSYSPQTDTLYIFLEDSVTRKAFEVAINDPSGTLPSTLPDGVGLTTDQEPQFVFSTAKGFVIREWNGTYTLYSQSDGSVIDRKKIEIEDEKQYLEAIDSSGNHRYVFNANNWMLYHSRFWW